MSESKRIALLAVVLLIAAISASAQNNAEQIVFSATGANMTLSNTSKNQPTSTPFGFWVWCAGSAAPGSNGGYQNDNACQGSMYFYELFRSAVHVIGFVTESSGIYTMNLVEGTPAELFSGTLNPSFTCTLTNTVPDAQGQISSDVKAKCMFLKAPYAGVTGASTATNAVVQVTGPK